MNVASLTMSKQDQELFARAEAGIGSYLNAERDAGRIAGGYYDDAVAHTAANLKKWFFASELDEISPHLRDGLREAIRQERWVELTNAYSRDVAFGTGGIREKMGANRDAVVCLKKEGIHAPIIKGPNTINDVIYLLTSAGVARFGIDHDPPLHKTVIGFDSRVRGGDFARLIASLFLAYDYTVYLFDEACMYPSVTYAVPTLGADVGVFISASHNDFRYNGYKLSCQNGSQFDPDQRNKLYEKYICTTTFAHIKTLSIADAPRDKLWFLGGKRSRDGRTIRGGEHAGLPLADPLEEAGDLYAGRRDRVIDVHTMHVNHTKRFLLNPKMIAGAKRPLSIGFSAFNGSGRKAVPRLLAEIGFKDVRRIMKLDSLDGMFPAFCSDPGKEQQPDPGDWRAADIAVSAFKEEHGRAWDDVDLIVGTDPDADRCGVIVKVPPHQRKAYTHPGTGEQRDYSLLSADEAWTLILWYRLTREIEQHGHIVDAEKKFIVLSHTTTDLLCRLAGKFGLGVMKTWVGFAQLAAATRAVWDLHAGKDTEGLTRGGCLPVYTEGTTKPDQRRANRTIHSWERMEATSRCINIAALEQSNGFTILGGPPPNAASMGENGHVRDKDGTFAALLMAELAQFAKEQSVHLIDLLDEKIYLDRDIGLYITHYEPDPLDGEYEGLAGYTKKRSILDKAEDLFANWGKNPIALGGLTVESATVYRTGKYDAVNWDGFPDEGYRFFFDDDRQSHLTIRPSGTSNALRFHVQLFGGHLSREELIDRKAKLRATCAKIIAEIKERLGAVS